MLGRDCVIQRLLGLLAFEFVLKLESFKWFSSLFISAMMDKINSDPKQWKQLIRALKIRAQKKKKNPLFVRFSSLPFVLIISYNDRKLADAKGN